MMRGARTADAPAVLGLETAVYVVPTDAPEADGTFAWDETTMVLATARAAGEQGIGWSYTAAAAQSVVTDVLAGVVVGCNALDVAGAAAAMARAIRNIGRAGIAAMAISAVDIALRDLKARLPGCPVTSLLGRVHNDVPVYGSGGFTSYDEQQTRRDRCGGISEFLRGAALAAASNLQMSAHCAPNLHARVAAAVPNLRHVEYFHDHQRIEQMLFDGVLDPGGGVLTPDPGRPGLGMQLRAAAAERYRRG
jgi:L-alanine-DL-glutamate epimerase-like enolase superfamily enzyme